MGLIGGTVADLITVWYCYGHVSSIGGNINNKNSEMYLKLSCLKWWSQMVGIRKVLNKWKLVYDYQK